MLTGAPWSPSRGLQTSEGREKSPCNWAGQENPRARSLERPHTGREVGQDGAALQCPWGERRSRSRTEARNAPRPRGQPRTPGRSRASAVSGAEAQALADRPAGSAGGGAHSLLGPRSRFLPLALSNAQPSTRCRRARQARAPGGQRRLGAEQQD